MPARELIEAQARLLSNAEMRAEFARDPRALAGRLGLAEEDTPAFFALDAAGLEAQAQTLLGKRMHEAAKLLPETFLRGGDEARKRFSEFAECFWPEGHRRHLEDAARFSEWLLARGAPWACRAEIQWIRFIAGGRRFSFSFFAGAGEERRLRPGVFVFFRSRGGAPRRVAFYLGL